MNMLVAYDRACTQLAEAREIKDVLAIRDVLAHIKLHAQQIQDKILLANAVEFQMRAERRLGEMMEVSRERGELARSGQRGPARKSPEPAARPATLKEIGVGNRLSIKAQNAAALETAAFEALITESRDKIRSGRAILVDPIDQAAKTAELDGRRAAHAARTLNGGRIEDLGKLALSGYRAGFIGTDPQWKFLTRSAAGEGRSANVHYKTEEVDRIKNIPVGELAADNSILGMWMVDWCPQDALDLITHYGFQHKTTLYTWIKTNGSDPDLDVWSNATWHIGQGFWSRANPEDCWLATKGNPKRLHADVRQLIIAPIMEHSRKPDEWLSRTERLCEGPYLELQARRTRPGWMSWGDELEWTGEVA